MELLKNIVDQQKRNVSQLKAKCGKPWIPRKDIEEQKKRECLLALEEEEAKRQEQELARFARLSQFLDGKKRPKPGQSQNSYSGSVDENAEVKHFRFEEALLQVSPDDPPPVPKEEVIRRLRRRGHVVTYFGETDTGRYNRLYQLELAEHDDELMEGQQNVFLQLLEDQDKKRGGRRKPGLSGKEDEHSDDEEDDHDHPSRPRRSSAHTRDPAATDSGSKASHSENAAPTGQGEATLDKEARIRSWINKMLRLWEAELDERSESEKVSNLGKIATAQYRQTWKDLRPLLKKLKHRDMDSNVLSMIHDMVVFCEDKDYKKAHDRYIELSIGNAAWPMGVTMVGIHERAGRSKIFTSEIAHILNDETTRKYIHMIKRLISFCQRRFPADPSAMVSISTTHI